MDQYRCYFLNAHGHVISFVTIIMATDALACAEADKLWQASPHQGVELWSGSQMIHHVVKAMV
jgi:hypothetical protein